MEVTVVKTRKILSTIGTFAIVGAVSTAGAALWTNVLDRKFQMVKVRLTHPKSDKIIFVDWALLCGRMFWTGNFKWSKSD